MMVSNPIEAPGDLELVRTFVNTLDPDTGKDALSTPGQMEEWFVSRKLVEAGARVKPADIGKAIDLRSALRSVLRANNGEILESKAVETIDRIARQSRLGVRFQSQDLATLEPTASGVLGGLGRLLAIVASSMTRGTWTRLKACRAEDCRWAFYDHAKNRSRVWCSMSICGNRTKVKAFRDRQSK